MHACRRLPAGAARSPNAVRVGFDFGGHVVVDHVLDPGDVQTARGKRRGDQHAARTRLEALDGLLAVPLLVVTVDGGGLHALRHEEIAEPITRALPLDEYHLQKGKLVIRKFLELETHTHTNKSTVRPEWVLRSLRSSALRW